MPIVLLALAVGMVPGLPWSPLHQTGSVMAVSTVSMLTQHNDNAHTGANLNETALTTSNVNAATFGKLFTRSVDGQLYAQPLYVPNLTINGGTHNVVFLATMHNTVYAFDADDPAQSSPLWSVNLGPSIPVPDPCFGSTDGPYGDIQVEVGIVSTPVIDPASNTLYVVAATKDGTSIYPNCNPGAYVHRLHALDLLTGHEKLNGPVVIRASAPGSGPDASNGAITLQDMQQLQRPALALANGNVYFAFGSYADSGTYHGWLLSYNAGTLQQNGVFLTTPDVATDAYQTLPYQGGIWQSGQAPSFDANGNLYLSISNGDVNAGTGGSDYSDSVVELSPSLKVVSYFTPYNVGYLNQYDVDLGSAGVLLMPGTSYALTGGKQGTLYLLKEGSLGGFNATSDNVVQSFSVSNGELHGAPIYWNGPNGPTVYVWGANDYLKAFSFSNNTFQTTPASQSPNQVPPNTPGGFLSLSANGSTAGTGIVWAARALTSGSNTQTVAGILEAYDATNLGHVLWTSQQNATRDAVGNFAKFAPPTVANGKVYLGTFSNRLDVYGLLNGGTGDALTPVPSPWADADIGSVGVAGSAGYANGTGTFTLNGSGDDIWNTADAFHFVYQSWSGDGQIVAHVASQTNTDPWAKAGVMFRATLDPGSTFADMILTPGNGASFQDRPGTGGQCGYAVNPASTVPAWVKLVRQGDTFTGYVSGDGSSWSQVGSATIPMAGGIYVGLAVTAHNNAAISTADFDHVAVTAADPPPPSLPSPWADADVGSVGQAGSASFSSGTFTVSGSGSDIWDYPDSFHFVYQPWSGDGQIVAHVASQTNTDPFAKAGVMFRAGLGAGDAWADIVATPGNGMRCQGQSGGDPYDAQGPAVAAPYWVKIVRQGAQFTCYTSPDGTAWTPAGQTLFSVPLTMYVGLAVTAHNNAATSTATFDHVAVSGPSGSTLSNGLVGYWTFDENGGTTAADSSGNGNTGTLTAGAGWADGAFGSAVTFDGASGYVSAGVHNLPAANAPQSISWWLYYSSVPSGVQNVISITNDSSGSAVQPGFRNGVMGVWEYGGSFLVSAAPPSAGAWHHYAYTFDGATHRLYVDGTLQASSTTAPQSAVPTELNFGRWTGGFEYLDGSLDDVRIYNRALNQMEVQTLAGQP